MVISRMQNGNTDPKEMKPGPHIDMDGIHHLPVGTFHEMLRRARGLEPPKPFNDEFKIRFVESLQKDESFRQVLKGILDG